MVVSRTKRNTRDGRGPTTKRGRRRTGKDFVAMAADRDSALASGRSDCWNRRDKRTKNSMRESNWP